MSIFIKDKSLDYKMLIKMSQCKDWTVEEIEYIKDNLNRLLEVLEEFEIQLEEAKDNAQEFENDMADLQDLVSKYKRRR